MKNFRRILFAFMIFTVISPLLIHPVHAQCGGWLPAILDNLLCGNPIPQLQNRVQASVLLAIVILLVVGGGYMFYSGFKYYQGGQSGDFTEAVNSMKGVFLGVAAFFFGLPVFALAIMFFIRKIPLPSTVCLQAPDSYGCFACTESSGSNPKLEDICNYCNESPTADIPKADLKCDQEIVSGETKSITEGKLEKIDKTDLSKP